MKNLREIVPQNITRLRKENNLTQAELAQKINYSDKAISRWEKGEVLPDIETIQKLAEIFDVSLYEILEETTSTTPRKTKLTKQEILSQVLFICEIWILISVIYAYLHISRGINLWQLFTWGIPATALLIIVLNRHKNNNLISFIYGTIFVWSCITCLFLHMLAYRPWYFFVLGVPMQGILIVRYIFNYKQKKLQITLPKIKHK